MRTETAESQKKFKSVSLIIRIKLAERMDFYKKFFNGFSGH